jgi:hypothetical protein
MAWFITYFTWWYVSHRPKSPVSILTTSKKKSVLLLLQTVQILNGRRQYNRLEFLFCVLTNAPTVACIIYISVTFTSDCTNTQWAASTESFRIHFVCSNNTHQLLRVLFTSVLLLLQTVQILNGRRQ